MTATTPDFWLSLFLASYPRTQVGSPIPCYSLGLGLRKSKSMVWSHILHKPLEPLLFGIPCSAQLAPSLNVYLLNKWLLGTYQASGAVLTWGIK